MAVETQSDQSLVERAASALADVDSAVWTQRFDLLSDPNRLEILLTLHRAPGICVGDLAAALGRSENAVSQALRVLRQQGWVSSTRIGRSVSYRLEDEIVHDLDDAGIHPRLTNTTLPHTTSCPVRNRSSRFPTVAPWTRG